MRALLCHPFALSAWSQPATVVAGTSGEGDAMASVRWFGVGSASHCVGGYEVESGALASVRLVGIGSASQFWRIRQLRVPLWPLFHRSVLDQPASVLAGTTGEGVALASFRSFGFESANPHGGGTPGEGVALASFRSFSVETAYLCGGVNDRFRALLYPLFARWARAQTVYLFAGATGEGAALASGR